MKLGAAILLATAIGMGAIGMGALGLGALGLVGCSSPAPAEVGYFGDTLTLPQLVERVNQNNDKLPTLWAREKFEAEIVDRKKNKTNRIDGYGNLLFTGPNQMKLTAKNEVADLFEMGSGCGRSMTRSFGGGNTLIWTRWMRRRFRCGRTW